MPLSDSSRHAGSANKAATTWTFSAASQRSSCGNGSFSITNGASSSASKYTRLAHPMINAPNPENPVMADLAPLVLRELGRDDGVGIDLKAAYCAGFLRGLELMDALLDNPAYRCGLLVASDEGGRANLEEFGKLYERVPVETAQRAVRFWKVRTAA